MNALGAESNLGQAHVLPHLSLSSRIPGLQGRSSLRHFAISARRLGRGARELRTSSIRTTGLA
eukprot:3290195-Pleurochrysis_carterae.AAC.2